MGPKDTRTCILVFSFFRTREGDVLSLSPGYRRSGDCGRLLMCLLPLLIFFHRGVKIRRLESKAIVVTFPRREFLP
jgi:hypothetical protein